MSLRRSSSIGTLAGKLNRLIKGRSKSKNDKRRRARRRLFEHLEARELMALNIISVSPLDGATEVPLNSNLVFTFNQNVTKGQGNIYVIQKSTGTTGFELDVNSPNVVVSGAQVTVDLPSDLSFNTSYFVNIDNGAFLDGSATQTVGGTLLQQDYDFQPLKPFVNTGAFGAGDGTDWTEIPPNGWTAPTTLTNGAVEYRGWTLLDKNSWVSSQGGGQGRTEFTLAKGNVAVGDTDAFDDVKPASPFTGFLLTKPINLSGVAANSVKLEFDSSFRPEGDAVDTDQIGILEVSYDGGTSWTQLLRLDSSNMSPDGSGAVSKNINEHLVSGTNTGLSTDGKGNVPFGAVNNPSSGSMVFRLGLTGTNDFWWAIDNVKVTGTVTGVPFTGISDAVTWDFSTPEPIKVAFDKGYISENGGTATGTVTRLGSLVGDVIVSLVSSDTTEATVPATVTILNGQSSANFTVTGVDDLLLDRTQLVTVVATPSVGAPGFATIKVTDDEGPDITALSPADNATGVFYRSDFKVTFDTNVKKGSGRVHIIEKSTGVLGETIDVNSANVTISGATVTINPTLDLKIQTEYYVLFDDGAILDTSAAVTNGTVLLSETFDLLPLGPFTLETGGDGTDFTKTPPLGFLVNNSQMPGGSTSEFDGWSFMDKNSWINASGDKSGNNFTRGSGTVAVADPQEWDQRPHNPGQFNSFLITAPIDLSTVTAGTVSLEFDSSFLKSDTLPFGTVEVSYNNGTSWSPLLFFGDASNPNDGRNQRVVMTSANTVGQFIGAATVDAQLNSPASGQMRFRFGMQAGTGANNWWAVDNLVVRGRRTGVPFAGIEDPTAWNVKTGNLPVLSVTIDKTSMSENGGTAVGTVSRTETTVGDLVVNLSSSDITEATVPATVTILDGASFATFPITAVDDAILDVPQTVTISSTATDYGSGSNQIVVTDDEFGIIGVSPLPGDNSVPVDSLFSVQFNQNIRKGNGFIHLVRKSDNKVGLSVDVNSPSVTVSGDTLTIDFPENLGGVTQYYGLVDSGAVLTTLSLSTANATLLSQNFEFIPLGPAIFETAGVTLDGKDFSAIPPKDWAVNNTQMPPGGAPEWTGWTFADKGFWATQGGQDRASFTRGSGTIAVGDTDEWDDYSRPNNSFNSFFTTNAIDLSSVAANSVKIEFDSSFRPEGAINPTPPTNNQTGLLDVSYDGGATWTNILTLDRTNTDGRVPSPTGATNVNERRSVIVPNPDTGSLKFRWGLTGTNDWWWAIDNIVVTGTTDNFPFPGLLDPSAYNITTAVAPTLTVDAPATVAENGGVVSATVSRNLGTSGPLTVSLVSGDTTVGTVPASVVIPDGAASVSFNVTILDDAFFDSTKPLKITASAVGFVAGEDVVSVSDNETGEVKITEIMYDPAGSEPRTEWVEVLNNGTTPVDLSGWKLDDEDKQKWGVIPAGATLDPGQVAVIYNSFFTLNTDTLFRTEWKVPAAAKVFGVFWSPGAGNDGLANDPTNVALPGVSNEVLVLRDASQTSLDEVNFAEDGTVWPAYSNGSSIYLAEAALDNSIGTNWLSARIGIDGGTSPSGSTFSTADRGSPGVVTTNDAPTLTVSTASLSGNVLSIFSNSGTWADANLGDIVTLTSSLGNVIKNADGTWSWSFTPSQAYTNQAVTVTATDDKGSSSQVAFAITAKVALVNSKVFYKGSSYAGLGVDNALDTGKVIAKSSAVSQTLTFANLVNSTRGINGIVLDVAGLAASSLTAADFGFRMSPTGAFNAAANPPSSWANAPAPTAIVVTAGTATTPARVRIEWADNAIANRWLQIKVLANANTGLAASEVHYLGHLTGETNGLIEAGGFFVRSTDVGLITGQINPAVQVPVTSLLDLNKDGRIRTTDSAAAIGALGLRLTQITIPPAGSGDEGEGGYGGGSLFAAPGVEFPKNGDSGISSEIKARWTDENFDVPLPLSMVAAVAATRISSIGSVTPDSESPTEGAQGWVSLDSYFEELAGKRVGRRLR